MKPGNIYEEVPKALFIGKEEKSALYLGTTGIITGYSSFFKGMKGAPSGELCGFSKITTKLTGAGFFASGAAPG